MKFFERNGNSPYVTILQVMDWSSYLWMRQARMSLYMYVITAEQCPGAMLCYEMCLFKVINTHQQQP